jgi:hypothetical protein
VGHTPITPLRIEEMLDLAERPVGIVMSDTDRDKRGIPAPLMRVQARSRFGPTTDVVARQDSEGFIA